MTTVGEALVKALEAQGVDTVFGIPGVHTVELYRGLAGSGIRHVTPRHEQGAGFMADGYARVSGRPGVAFVITGPGLMNTITPMAQARADSIPMLVISGVNRRDTLGKGLGHLHEMPDQLGVASLVALSAERVTTAADLAPVLDRVWSGFSSERPGPRQIEVPLDVMPLDASPVAPSPEKASDFPRAADIARAAAMLADATAPLILAGGGARFGDTALRALANRIDAPVVQTVNARGLMHGDPLSVPASPSLEAVRRLIEQADVVLAVGTEFGPTDYDMYGRGGAPWPKQLIRIEIDTEQMARHPVDLPLCGRSGPLLDALLSLLPAAEACKNGATRAEATRKAARAELDPAMTAQLELLEALRDAVPGAIMVGDSTQVIYAGNLYYDHDRPAGWFNAATGYGALGFSIPAAIGACFACPDAHVLCLCGDGGAQFTLPELMTAVDENLPIRFLIWNNHAYGEIASSMEAAGIEVVGCHPTPPDFEHIARACGMPFRRVAMKPGEVVGALRDLQAIAGPAMIEITMPS
ncbi:5-guanidino-2-oxopentanoate decarboxylase [Defluviimonas aestuarii]|uniref:5-guanidino-2-oxopentanoate decarboxylase n=1 Tax=Albidovulum aestuarii TaxID=1130726 RepID=UPI00249CB85C|nr:5-guanidino-2-oxopentanoate decarboxylase [Defluviimonas aestuarii]MDI3338694.1 5-guanidino-2-oxopentanoate decarboxylase [Defluviimonas aestuarii]